jgi:anti-anti-sigma factor
MYFASGVGLMLVENKGTHFYVRLSLDDKDKFKRDFTALVEDFYSSSKGPIIVDVGDCETLDSSLLGVLLIASRRAEGAGSKLALLKVNENIKNILDITKMSTKMPFFADEFTALKALSPKK